jgi:hypothetical protein
MRKLPHKRPTISSIAASARASISARVWSWMGCGTYTASSAARPRYAACARAAVRNSWVATGTDGIPSPSNFTVSCKLHVVQDPQSARPSITASGRAASSRSITAAGAGFEKAGLRSRTTRATP